jgi:cytidylate kinase
VFIGHGAAAVLSGEPGLFRVLCHAPREFRIDRLRQLYPQYREQDAAAAVDKSDRQQQRYLKSVAGINWRDATAYDLTLNTALAGVDEAVALIANLIETRRGY